MICVSQTRRAVLFLLVSAGGLAACANESYAMRELEVVSTAYNSTASQTANDPTLAAWGDRLRPGMMAIAVSRDLIEHGLSRGVEVEIDGLPGRYTVLDKLGGRWTERIDIYMGEDVAAAKAWGKRRVTIQWQPAPSS